MDIILSSGLSSAVTKPIIRKNKKPIATVVFPVIIDIERWKATEASISSEFQVFWEKGFIQIKVFLKTSILKTGKYIPTLVKHLRRTPNPPNVFLYSDARQLRQFSEETPNPQRD